MDWLKRFQDIHARDQNVNIITSRLKHGYGFRAGRIWEKCTGHIWVVNLCNAWTQSGIFQLFWAIFFGVDIICALEFNSPYFFPTFQLGGPLALPWGLYVLICQVQRISVTLYLQPCKLFLIKVQISWTENTRKTMPERCDRGWNMEEGTCRDSNYSGCFDTPACMGRTRRRGRHRACKHILML